LSGAKGDPSGPRPAPAAAGRSPTCGPPGAASAPPAEVGALHREAGHRLMHLPVLAGAVGLAPLRALRWRSVACCRSRYDMLTRSLPPGSPDPTRSLTAVRLLHSVYYSTLMLALRQTAPAARGRQLPPTGTPPCQETLPVRAPTPHADHDTDS